MRFSFGKEDPAREKYRSDIQDSIRKKWPKDSIELEELVYHRYDEDGEIGKPTNGKTNILIFIDRALDLDWLADPDASTTTLKLLARPLNLESLPHKHLSRTDIIEFKKILGQAMIAAFNEDSIEVERQCKIAAQFYKKRITEKSRTWILSIVLPFALLVFGYIVVTGFFSSCNVSTQDIFVASTISGVLGAIMSLIQKTGASSLDSSSGLRLHFLEVIAKLTVGAMSGFFAVYIGRSLISSEFIALLLKDVEGFVTLSFIAGFSERIIPQMVSKFDGKLEGE